MSARNGKRCTPALFRLERPSCLRAAGANAHAPHGGGKSRASQRPRAWAAGGERGRRARPQRVPGRLVGGVGVADPALRAQSCKGRKPLGARRLLDLCVLTTEDTAERKPRCNTAASSLQPLGCAAWIHSGASTLELLPGPKSVRRDPVLAGSSGERQAEALRQEGQTQTWNTHPLLIGQPVDPRLDGSPLTNSPGGLWSSLRKRIR